MISTRQFWPLSENRINKVKSNGEFYYEYAFTMKGNKVMNIFKILQWFLLIRLFHLENIKYTTKNLKNGNLLERGRILMNIKNLKIQKKLNAIIGSKPPEMF